MNRQEKRRELNLPLLIGSVLLLAVLAPAVYFWHSYQLTRTAGALLSRAEELEQDQQWLTAAEYVNRYLSLQPEDLDARVRLAEDYSKGADTPQRKFRAVDLYYRAIGLTKDITEKADVVQSLRIGLTENLLALGRFQNATEQATQITDESNKPTVMRLLALALYGEKRSGKPEPRDRSITAEEIENWPYDNLASQAPVSLVVEKALELSDPPDLELSLALALICRDTPDWLTDEQVAQFAKAPEEGATPSFKEKARSLMDQLRHGQPRNPDVLLAHYAFVVEDDPAAAERDLKDALAAAPDNVDVHLAAADFYFSKGRGITAPADDESDAPTESDTQRPNDPAAATEMLNRARQHYEQLVEMDPQLPAAHRGLGDVLLALDERDAAIAAWRRGLAKVDDAAQSLELRLRLVDGLIETAELDEAEEALQALETAIQVATPRATKAQLNAWGLASSLRWARLHLARKNYAQAAPLLERLTADSSRMSAGPKAELLALLAASRAALGEWDSAATTYDKAAKINSGEDDGRETDGTSRNVDNDRFRETAAIAWERAGRPAEAIRRFESIALRTPDGLIAEARARLQQQFARPRADRNWSSFLQVQEKLESFLDGEVEVSQPWRIPLLRFDYQRGLNTKESHAAAFATLAETEKTYGDDVELQQRLVLIYENLGQPERADAALARVAKAAPLHRAALLEARLLSQREEFPKARQRLEAALKEYPPAEYPAESASLKVGLAQLETAQGNFETAMRDLQGLGEPSLARTRQLAELALRTMPPGKPADAPAWDRWSARLKKWEDQLRALEGSQGTHWRYYRARRLVGLATSPTDARLSQAAQLQDSLHTSRPYWPAAQVLKALIAEKSGHPDQAIEAYEEAVRLGELQVGIYYRLIFLLNAAGRASEAQQYCARLEDDIPSSPELSDLALQVFVQSNKIDEAVDIADKAVRERPLDVMAHVSYGQTLLQRSLKSADEQIQTSDRAHAEQVLKNACLIADNKDVRPINGLFVFYLDTGQRDKARETLQLVEQVSGVDDQTRAFILAQGYEGLGEKALAEEHYLAAQRLVPDNTLIPMRLARLYMQNSEGEKAEATLRRALQIDSAVRPARRMLATLLAARGGEEEWREARQLLSPEVGEGGEVSHLDERLQAILLARRGRPADIDEALEMLTRLVEQAGDTGPGDRVMLAQVCMMKHELPETDEATRLSLAAAARRQYLALVNAAEVDPNHVALYINFLLEQQDWQTAESYLEKLDRLEPDAIRPIGLRAKWLKARDRLADLAPRVEAWVAKSEKAVGEDPTEEELAALAQKYVQVGNIYSAIEAHVQAEPWYRRAVEMDERAYTSLAVSLARQPTREKTEEAIQIALREVKDSKDVDSAILLASVLVTGKTEAADFVAAEPIFQRRLRDDPDNPNLLLAIANVRFLQKRLHEAGRLYRRVIELRPRDAVAHNNLATLLAEQEDKQQDAMQHIQRAIEVAGELPALLDTKGTILLNENRVAEAVAILRRAAVADDPRFLLHLVIALDRQGETDEARRQWRRLDQDRLSHSILSSADEQARERLAGLYERGGAS